MEVLMFLPCQQHAIFTLPAIVYHVVNPSTTIIRKCHIYKIPTTTTAAAAAAPSFCRGRRRSFATKAATGSQSPLDLTEENVEQVLIDARLELAQIFDGEVGITGEVGLVELDGPYVTISLKGRFWHKRSDVLARIANYLKNRIPEILEVDIEDDKQLDDSPANF